MSFLQQEIPSPRQALTALRERRNLSGPTSPKASGPGPKARPARGGGRGVVGLDIEAGYIAAAETTPGQLGVRRAAAVDLPVDLVRDGEVIDPLGLGEVLKEFFAEHKLPSRVRLGLANQRVVMRTVDLPPIDDAKQLASAVRFQAQEHIAMPLDQAVLEHHSLGIVGTADGPRSRVVLVAARKEMVMRLLTAINHAGLRAEGVDLSAFALIRALHRPGDPGVPTAYVNVGSNANLVIATGTQALFTRVMPYGYEDLIKDLSERRALTREHAQGWLRHVGLVESLEQIEGEPQIAQAAREVLEDGVARLANEVHTSLEFFAGQSGVRTERLTVTGPAVAAPGFADRFGADVGRPLEIRTVPEAVPGAFGSHDPAQFSVAAGLTTSEAFK